MFVNKRITEHNNNVQKQEVTVALNADERKLVNQVLTLYRTGIAAMRQLAKITANLDAGHYKPQSGFETRYIEGKKYYSSNHEVCLNRYGEELHPSDPECDYTPYTRVYPVWKPCNGKGNCLPRHINKPQRFKPQSGMEANISKTSTKTEENVTFSESDQYVYELSSHYDPVRNTRDNTDASLERFFERPILIDSRSWTLGGEFDFTFNPWSLYCQDTRVSNRLNNFNLMKATLHLKVTVNGNGFYAGRQLVSYLPYAAVDESSIIGSYPSKTQMSQMPHVMLNPTTSEGGEIVCPFFWHKDYLSIVNSEWQQMGQVYSRTLSFLRNMNAVDAPALTINTFAWLEDVTMSVPTTLDNTTLQPQAGMEKKKKKKSPKKKTNSYKINGDETDEANTSGMISGPATTIAKVAGMLSKAPVIGPFALATETAMNATSSIAKLFGYSRPVQTVNPCPYRPTAISSLANTTLPDTLSKLTVDDKQQLSIDPKISGIDSGADPMSILNIATRESYLTSFTWAADDTPEQHLFDIRVDPCQFVEEAGGRLILPACCAAALPFKYWTGTLKFRFVIAASNFNKGRLRFSYDPNYHADGGYNLNYIKVVDVEEETDFTIEVGNGQTTTLLDHARPGLDSATTMHGSQTFAGTSYGNGVLSCHVLNSLTFPSNYTTNISVLVFVSAGDDFEVFVPDENTTRYVFKPQSGMEDKADTIGGAEENAPVQEQTTVLNDSEMRSPDLNVVYTGEAIASFRPLLKRYALHSTMLDPTTQTGVVMYAGRRAMFPYYRGNVTGAVHTTTTDASYNYCNTLLLHWVVQGFQAWRGSLRWRLLPNGAVGDNLTMYVQRAPKGQTTKYYNSSNQIAGYGTESQQAAASVLEGGATPASLRTLGSFNGAEYRVSKVNPVMDFEMPFYSDERFVPGKQLNLTTGADEIEVFDYRILANRATGTVPDDVQAYISVGEDFQVYMWTGMPPVYYEQTAPVPKAAA